MLLLKNGRPRDTGKAKYIFTIFSDNSLFFLTLVYEKGIFVGIFSFIIRIKKG